MSCNSDLQHCESKLSVIEPLFYDARSRLELIQWATTATLDQVNAVLVYAREVSRPPRDPE